MWLLPPPGLTGVLSLLRARSSKPSQEEGSLKWVEPLATGLRPQHGGAIYFSLALFCLQNQICSEVEIVCWSPLTAQHEEQSQPPAEREEVLGVCCTTHPLLNCSLLLSDPSGPVTEEEAAVLGTYLLLLQDLGVLPSR
jgi:hypothetical protein